MKQGKLRAFTGYAGRPGGAAVVSNPWEYSMMMQSAQFAPAPAGISAEQFRIWEAFEAGEAAVKSNTTDCCRLSFSLWYHTLLLPTEARCIFRQAAGKGCWQYHSFFSQMMYEAWCPSEKTKVSLARNPWHCNHPRSHISQRMTTCSTLVASTKVGAIASHGQGLEIAGSRPAAPSEALLLCWRS